MRQVDMLSNMIANVVFDKSLPVYEIVNPDIRTATDLLHNQLIELLEQGRINESEDLLFEKLVTEDENYLLVAHDFYFRLNEHDDAYLEQHGFSREEIDKGLAEIRKRFCIDT